MIVEAITESKLAYLAGIMDGEGSIYIAKQQEKRHPNPSYILRISVTSTDKVLCEWIMESFGGHIIHDHRQSRRGNGWKDAYHWRITGDKAKCILESIIPFLIIKKTKAEYAILFQQQKRGSGKRGITQSQLEKELWFKEKITSIRCGG